MKSAYHLRHVCSSVRPSSCIYQRGSNWKYFCEISYCRLSWKPVKRTNIWLKYYKTIGHLTQKPKEVSLFLATINRHNRATLAEMGLRLFVGSSVPPDRLSACIRAAPYARIYVKLYNGDFCANLSRNYNYVLLSSATLKRSLRVKWYQSTGIGEEQLKNSWLSGRGLFQVGNRCKSPSYIISLLNSWNIEGKNILWRKQIYGFTHLISDLKPGY